MARLLFTQRFMDDAKAIWSPKVRDRLVRILKMLESFPEAGSSLVPQSIKSEFGNRIRKCALNPFDIVYEYDTKTDTVILLGLIPQKRAR